MAGKAGKSNRIGLRSLIIQVFIGVLKRGARFEMLELHLGKLKVVKGELDYFKKYIRKYMIIYIYISLREDHDVS